MRVGIVHSAANLVATGLFAASFVQRARGRHGSGKVLSFTGLAFVSAAAFPGGHLSYRQAAGMNRAADIVDRFPRGWHAIGALSDLAEGRLIRCTVGELLLVVYRRGEHVMVLSDTCSHLSGPLSDGSLASGERTASAEPCVECPWHGSTFPLISGDVVAAPRPHTSPCSARGSSQAPSRRTCPKRASAVE
ncbi:nitrite reductase/ring-hydroxylating ferredoxin subunit [Marisediminicola sp. UYEF4]|uniref:Rieske (2Fe-2S) protein n=1 Tax=Marisediminicola sp. UYEF4 TaxID=1756384 RepID=UPI0033982D94